jgi:hypothetical protein
MKLTYSLTPLEMERLIAILRTSTNPHARELAEKIIVQRETQLKKKP